MTVNTGYTDIGKSIVIGLGLSSYSALLKLSSESSSIKSESNQALDYVPVHKDRHTN